jgi:hypothetical protein
MGFMNWWGIRPKAQIIWSISFSIGPGKCNEVVTWSVERMVRGSGQVDNFVYVGRRVGGIRGV